MEPVTSTSACPTAAVVGDPFTRLEYFGMSVSAARDNGSTTSPVVISDALPAAATLHEACTAVWLPIVVCGTIFDERQEMFDLMLSPS